MKGIGVKNQNHISITILCAAILLLSLCLSIKNGSTIYLSGFENHTYHGFCLFEKVTGIQCPTCGLTKSFISISHLQFDKAWHFNKAGILIYIIIVLQIPYRLFLMLKEQNIIIASKLKRLSTIYTYLVFITLFVGWFYNLFGNRFI